MGPIRSLLLYVLTIFVGGALLAPGLYWLAQWTGVEWLMRYPFHRFVSRGMQVVALVGLWPFLRSLGVHSWSSIGVVKPATQWKRLGCGFALGFGSLALVAALPLIFGARGLDGGIAGRWWGKLPLISLAAVVVAIVEELLFRGALFSALRRAHGWKPALLVSSMLYAILHFFQKVDSKGPVTWASGLETLSQMVEGFVQPAILLPGFLSLTLAGSMLGLAFQRTGTLYFSIGLHAGWIFWLKCYVVVTNSRAGAATSFWGTAKLYDGWLGLLVLVAASVVVWRLSSSAAAPEPGAEVGNDSLMPQLDKSGHD